MAFDECIDICAQGHNPNSLHWLEPPGSCLDTSSCGSNQICDFSAESANPVYGWCMDCPGTSAGTSAEDCQSAFNQVGLNGLGFDECISFCAGGQNPNGIQHIPDPDVQGESTIKVKCDPGIKPVDQVNMHSYHEFWIFLGKRAR